LIGKQIDTSFIFYTNSIELGRFWINIILDTGAIILLRWCNGLGVDYFVLAVILKIEDYLTQIRVSSLLKIIRGLKLVKRQILISCTFED
jgi:hypothetical protein